MGKRGQTIRTLTLCAALLAGQAGFAGECRDDQLHLRGEWGEARFAVDVADTDETRARGLMHVEEMPRLSGMLFVYPRPKTVGFWMKNTLIPLDMIFMDATGTVQKVHANAVPLDETPILGGSNIKLVLEINGGMAETLGIAPGSEMRHPAVEQDKAAWACAEGDP